MADLHSTKTSFAKEACTALSIAFANGVDSRDYARVVDVFADDAVLEHWDRSFNGREEIAAMLEARPFDMQTRHFCTNIEITQDADHAASGITYFLFFRGTENDNGPLPLNGPNLFGEYRDQFRLTDSGWRIAHRKIEIVFGDIPGGPAKSDD